MHSFLTPVPIFSHTHTHPPHKHTMNPTGRSLSKITSEESASLHTMEKDTESNLLLYDSLRFSPFFPFKNCPG